MNDTQNTGDQPTLRKPTWIDKVILGIVAGLAAFGLHVILGDLAMRVSR